jgi:hypothetical protein
MKKIFALIVFFGLLYPDGAFAQNSVRLYPYQMIPSRHPDYLRYHVKSPDASFFNDKIQFIALRDLSGDYRQKLDQWVDKDKLGNILWVSYPLIFQDNLREVIDEIKKRNLYLFDLWGYIPGSGPGGYWTQFVIPDGVLELFETELGDRWLGMDNGEQDGRYVGSFAPRMYPLGTDRKQQYFNFQRHFQEMGDQLGNKMATLVSLNFGHYFLKEGIYTLIGAETAQGLPNSQIYYSFIRGAGKQYGVNWFGNASVWNRWGHKTYDSDATGIDGDYSSGGPLKGTSLGLLKRLIYTHLMYDCVAVGFEGAMRIDGEKLSPIGKIQQSAVKWVDKYGDPGLMYTPVALMTDFFSGWSFPRHLYSREAYKVWGNLPYELRDYLTDGMLDILYPGYQDASYYKDERGFITPNPYGDIADCLMSDAPLWVMKQYPVLVIADELQPGKEINDKLEAYVNEGGHLIITAGSLKNMPDGIAGIRTGSKSEVCAAPVAYKGQLVNEYAPYTLMELLYPASATIVQKNGDLPAVIEHSAGKGKITVIASPYGVVEEPQCELPVKVKEEVPLDKPYPILNHVKALMNDIFSSVQLFETNPELSLVTCSRGNNEYTVLISNGDWTPKEFSIRTKTGKIASITELPTDYSEMKAVGYTPKVKVNTSFGKNTANTIAGGNVRIFRVRLNNESGVSVMPESLPVPNTSGRALVLRNILDVKEEILSRPTFFTHYDRVVIDWRYLHTKEKEALKNESGWLKRQKLKMTIDLTSGLNLYPDLRIVNNDLPFYQKSMDIMKSVIDKMEILGADELLISTQRTIENNYTMEKFYDSLKESFQVLSDYAAKKNIRLILRQSIGRTPDTIEGLQKLVNGVNRQNFTLAPALSLLLNDEANLDDHLSRLKQMNIKDILISAPQRDIHEQMWNTNAPVYKSAKTKTMRKILSAFPQADCIMDGLYASPDEEYMDVKVMDILVIK